jgi:hypothetical protein
MHASWVRNQIDFWNSILVLDKLFLMKSVEMFREGLSDDCLSGRLTGLWSLAQLKWLVFFLVGCLKVKLLWLYVVYSIEISYMEMDKDTSKLSWSDQA